ncbi:MAG: tetratricopeptide repeat protein [Microscillaceae bacterium]|nr:tetratricopeptide repeat protein [Microscillaceae bacterium]
MWIRNLGWYFGMVGLLVVGASLALQAQNEAQNLQIAEEYFSRQEYEKAREIYDKLARSPRLAGTIYRNYFKTLLLLKDYKEAEKLVKKMARLEPENPIYFIDEGFCWEKQSRPEQATSLYELVLNNFRKVSQSVLRAAEHFLVIDQSEYAEKMLLAGRKAGRDRAAFAVELAQVYQLRNRPDEMIGEYLLYATQSRSNIDYVKGALQDRLTQAEDFDRLEQVLLQKLQQEANESTYNEFLLWLYIQQKRFYRAFIQAKALDKRFKLEGSELLSIGLISMRNEDFESAQKIFEYIIQTYPNGANYPSARHHFIQAKEEVVKRTYPINLDAIRSLIGDYQALIDELGKNYKTFDDMRAIAQLYAFYLDDKDRAITILEEAARLSQGYADFLAECKTDLGDIYLLKNEPWEATLLYSQVEKLKKDHPLGYEAKLRNAKLSYYKGEFELAEEHLNILKEATSREIANNAMALSLLIRDNLVFDTTGVALREYAQIELLMFQHKDEEALRRLIKMQSEFAGHTITDEVLWSHSLLLLKMGKATEALSLLEKIVQDYGDGILGDDAFFRMGLVYEETLQNKEKAQEIYKNHLIKYPGSIYTAEARRRFRVLRGDFLN